MVELLETTTTEACWSSIKYLWKKMA